MSQANKTSPVPQAHHSFSTDSLQQKLIKTRYSRTNSLIDEMISVRDSLQKQQLTTRINKQRVQQMHKKILHLQNIQKINNKIANRYLAKLGKLEDTQNIAVALLGNKINHQRNLQDQLYTRRQSCSQMRSILEQAKEKSLSFYHKLKTKRVQRIKQQISSLSLQKKRLNQTEFENRRNRTNQIKQSEMQAKDRLRRYQNFKLAQAKFNYQQKKQKLMQSHGQKLNLLKNLQKNIGNTQQIFRKTKILNKEVQQIESLYITGQ